MDVRFGPYQLRRHERRLLGPSGEVELSARSFDILAVLLDRPNEVVAKSELFNLVWPGTVVGENTLHVHVAALRRLLPPGMIVTVHGRGYKYAGPPPAGAETWTPHQPAAAGQPAAARKPVIVVLPFENQNGDSGQQYFSEGIAQDITDQLTRFHMFQVVARHWPSALGGSAPDFPRLRSMFNADFALTGGVRRLGERIRISVRLSDVPNETVLWAERYDCEAMELFGTQDEAVRAIVNTLEGRVISTAVEWARRKPTESWSAYDHLLQGRELCNGGSEPDAIPHFRSALALDPGFVLGHAWLSLALTVAYENAPREQLLLDAGEAARKAVLLDQNEPVAHWAAAMAALYAFRHDEAGRHFDRAIELNPGDVQLHADRSQWLRCIGRRTDALEEIDKALQQGPFMPPWFWSLRGEILFDLGRYEEARSALEKVPRKKSRVWFFLAAALAQQGDGASAVRMGKDILRQWPEARLSRLPFINPSACEDSTARLLQGLRMAGLPE